MLDPQSPAVLTVDRLGVQLGRRRILHDLTLPVRRGEITTIIGPNGCGKSTLLRTLGGLQSPSDGDVRVEGRHIAHVPRREFARLVSMLPQSPTAPQGMTVRELVSRGRQPHRPWYRQWSLDDERIVLEALEATSVAEFADRDLDDLSGGQRQRAWIAMCLAQQTPTVLLDEPTTYLDLAHQIDVLELCSQLQREGRTVVAVLHDLTLAARYSDRLVVVADGGVRADGAPGDVLSSDLLRDVFDLEAEVITASRDGLPVVVPVRRTPELAPVP